MVGIFITNSDLIIRSWDSWMTSATGVSAESAIGAGLVSLFPELEKRGMLARFERVLGHWRCRSACADLPSLSYSLRAARPV